MKLLVVRTSAHDPADYQDAARAYGECLRSYFDDAVWVHERTSGETCQPPVSWPTVAEARARTLASCAAFPLILSCTSPDYYACYPGAFNVGLSYCDTEALPCHGAEKPWVARVRAMDALWVPDTHSKYVFQEAGLPVRVVPYPVPSELHSLDDKSEGMGFDLDACPVGMNSLICFARFRGNLLRLQRLTRRLGPAVGELGVRRLEREASAIADSHPVIVCAGRDEPRQALRLLLAEWMEYRRCAAESPWLLLIHTAPASPDQSRFDLVASLWAHVQALKRQLDVRQSRVLLRFSAWDRFEPTRFVPLADAVVQAALGGGFAPTLAAARTLGKPIVCPRAAAEESALSGSEFEYETIPAILGCLRERQDSCDPVSHWPVPVPHALASAITHMQADWTKPGARPDFEVPPASSTEVIERELKRLEARFMRKKHTRGGLRPSRHRSTSS